MNCDKNVTNVCSSARLVSNDGLQHAQNGQEIRPAVKNLRGLQQAVCMAQEMGKGLGQCPLLFGQMPPGAIDGMDVGICNAAECRVTRMYRFPLLIGASSGGFDVVRAATPYPQFRVGMLQLPAYSGL